MNLSAGEINSGGALVVLDADRNLSHKEVVCRLNEIVL